MGQLSLLSVLAAFLITGVVVFNANRSANNADEKVWEHQYHVIARDAAATGMAAAVRDLTDSFVANTNWNPALATALERSDIPYDGGTYTIEATARNASNADACPLLNANEYQNKAMKDPSGDDYIPQGNVISIYATGAYQADVGNDVDQLHRHRITACYLKADYSLFSPPAFDFGFFAEDQFVFNGGPTIQALVDGEGHIHSNNNMELGPQVEIDGHATYVNSESIHHNADVTGGHGYGPTIPIVPFDATAFATANNVSPGTCNTGAPNSCRYDNGFAPSGDMTISPPSCTSTNCETDPFIWFINGDVTIGGGVHITVPQYTTIVATGNITISGNASLTVTGQDVHDVYGNNPTDAENLAWVQSQLFDGVHSPLAWFGEGGVTLNGATSVVGNFYVNGDVTLNGGGNGMNTVGSFASTLGDITANGGGNGNNFWFLEVAEENVIDGVKLPGKQIVRLALSEWTDPILDS